MVIKVVHMIWLLLKDGFKYNYLMLIILLVDVIRNKLMGILEKWAKI